MGLQEQIDSFQKMIFSHFRHSANNECRISALVPLVKESWGIYRFITSMMRAMYRREIPVLITDWAFNFVYRNERCRCSGTS